MESSHFGKSCREAMASIISMIFPFIFTLNGISGAEHRSIGGYNITDTPFPHQASLRIFGHHVCSGSIIDDKHILTTANCLVSSSGEVTDDLIVVTGTNNLVPGQGQRHSVEEIFIHEEYDGTVALHRRNNIAIVRLTSSIKFNERQNPISLPNADILSHQIATVSGWNYFGYPIVVGEMVQQTFEVETVNKDKCKKSGEMSCAVYRQKINGCLKNDFGSALSSDGVLIGITVTEFPCNEEHPVVFIVIFPYLSWIRSKLESP